jgi:phosphatidylserine/phosphatidylglycerophosphate/cardiolipin synthase-like enzyme
LIIEGKYKDEDGLEPLKNSSIYIKTDGERYKLMYHKFCVIDNKTTLTSSTNSTPNDLYLNNNNMIVIYSKNITNNYKINFKKRKLILNFQKQVFQLLIIKYI